MHWHRQFVNEWKKQTTSHPDKFPTSEAVENERKRLFGIIEDLVKWENSTNEEVLKRARAEIQNSCGGEAPPVYDPFSGGGSIPLEAQRLGLPAYGSDLNPVAVVIGKAMIEIPPLFKGKTPVHPGSAERTHYRNAEGLAEDVRYYGDWIRERAFERIGHLYPTVELPNEHGGGKATVIAWIWARTVPSPDPAFSKIEVPLVRSFNLSTKKGKEVWIEPVITGKGYKFELRSTRNNDVRVGPVGTVNRRGGVCIVSGAAMPFTYIRREGKEGRIKSRLMAIVAEGQNGRVYLSADMEHEALARQARPDRTIDVSLPRNPRDFKTPNYGIKSFGELFTDRQLVALNTFSELVHEAREEIEGAASVSGVVDDARPLRKGGTGAHAYAEAVSVYLGFGVSKLANLGSSITSWMTDRGALRETFARQAIPMVWDFAEANFFSNSGGNWATPIDKISQAIAAFMSDPPGSVVQANACDAAFETVAAISTDPPYYDNIGYADLSDFFFCWIKPMLKSVYPDMFGTLATPKQEELVATPYRHGGKKEAEMFFLNGMSEAMINMSQVCSADHPATIYYAFKQREISQEGVSSAGWATFLQAVIESGWVILGTWPIRTESAGRLMALGTNALANSVVLVCRKRDHRAESMGRAEFIRALKRELPSAIEALQRANISPADMPQASIGPGMAVFSRCEAVLEADDTPMSVKTALQLINRELDDYLRDIQGEFDPETRFALTWFEQHGFDAGEYGIANSIAMARGISVEAVRHAGIVEASGGKVRIFDRSEIDSDWEPDNDSHLTIWECSQHLVRALETLGERGAGTLLSKVGTARADATRDLAYCLYDIAANRRKDAAEATSWNGLIKVWSVLTKEAATAQHTVGGGQTALDI